MPASVSIRVILVRPLHSSNVGLICRVMKNFGFYDLVIVQPARKNVKTKTAYMYAKHSREVLENARVVPTLEVAVSDRQLVVGTTGVPNRFHRQLKQCIALPELRGRLKGKVALVFGSEGSGLNEAETNACDVLVYVPTNADHPVLNVSHAVAVVLHALSGMTWQPDPDAASLQQRRVLEAKFVRLISGADRIKDKKKVALSFRKLLSKARPTQDEVRTLMAGLAGLEKRGKKS